MVQAHFSLSWDSYKTNLSTGFSGLQQNIYTGQVSVPSNNLSSFIETAKTLHIKGLENIDEGTNKEIHTPKNESNSSISRTVGIKRKASTSDQINLPLTARKVLVKHGGNTTITLGDKKSQNMSDNEDTNDFSIENAIQDTDTDYNNTKNDKDKGTAQLTSSNLQYTVSIRGSLQVILNRYIYNLNSSQSSGVRRWRCTDYRNKKCNAFVVTQDNIVLNRANPHNHSFHDKKILDKIEKNAVYSAIDDVKGVIEKEKPKDNHPMESEFVSLSFNTDLDDLQDTKPL